MSDLKRRLRAQQTWLPGHELELWGEVPLVLHGHHFHLFWDQTIDDTLGPEVGQLVRTHAAREVFHDLLEQLVVRLEIDGASDRLRFFEELYAELGQGRVSLSLARDGGLVIADELHYGRSWLDKYGDRVRKRWPVDAVTAGFAAAATELAHDLPRESIDATERECVALGDRRCAIRVQPGTLAPRKGSVLGPKLAAALGPVPNDDDPELVELGEALRGYFSGVSGDERGLAAGPGLLWARMPAVYFGRVAAEALQHAQAVSPGSTPLLEALLIEAGRSDAFLSWGNLLAAPEWEAIAGQTPTEVSQVVRGGLAIARATGQGRWSLAELEPGQRLVVRSPGNAEVLHTLLREDRVQRGICFGAQGAVLGLALLAHHVDWSRRPELGLPHYEDLFRADLGWRVREPRCLAKGDPYCEVVAHRIHAG
jgi:hypothetical protein